MNLTQTGLYNQTRWLEARNLNLAEFTGPMSTLQRYAKLAIDFQLDPECDVSSYRSESDRPVTIYQYIYFLMINANYMS